MNLFKKLFGNNASKNKFSKTDSDPLLDETNGILTVLIAAIRRQDYKGFNSLMDAGVNVNETNVKGVTPLMVAADEGNIDFLSSLIAAGANLNTKDNIEGATALLIAVTKRDVRCVEALIKAGADVKMKDHKGRTPIYFASIYQLRNIERILVDAGA